MRKKINKGLAVITALTIIFSTVIPEHAYAVETQETETVSQNEIDITEEEETVSQNDIFSEQNEEPGKINYLYLETPNLQTPDTQHILIGFGDGSRAITGGILTIENYETKEQYIYESRQVLEDSVLFSADYSSQDVGIYEAVAAEFFMDDGSSECVRFSETGMAAVYFGVDREFSVSTEIPELQNPTLDMQIVTLDNSCASEAEAEQISDAVEDALNKTKADTKQTTISEKGLTLTEVDRAVAASVDSSKAAKKKGLVVVLDPGHDDTHAGARANGLYEEDLTLKVAEYCKEKLEEYGGVTVYMTRTSGACPNPGTSSVNDNASRVDYAQSVGADVYVSIHFNSSPSSGASGAEVFYPNGNYNFSIAAEGANLAKEIERKLVALGLNNRGVSIRNSEDGTTYPDGSLADYYGVIRRSKLAGFPGIIIEHAFLTNAGDAAFLKKESNLKKLGYADAQGIIDYYSLEEGDDSDDEEEGDVEAGKLSFENIDNIKGTFTLRLKDASADAGIKKVEISVWSKSDKSNLKTYTAKKQSDGSYTVDVKISNHGYQYGKYTAEAVVTAKDKGKDSVQKSKKISEPKPVVEIKPNVKLTKYTVTASDVACSNGVKTVKIAVWSKTGGKDDLIWYSTKKKGPGVYSGDITIAKHKTAGKYTTEIYVVDKAGNQKKIATKTFKVAAPTLGKLTFEDIDNVKGTFKVRLSKAESASGISSVKFTVWSKPDKSNAKTYTAKKQSDGSYLVTVKISKHGNQYGKYQAEASVLDKNKIEAKVKKAQKIEEPPIEIAVKANKDETQYTLTASSVTYSGGVTGVKFAVWSKLNGKDDLVWYKAKKSGKNWTAKVKISNHKDTGAYNAEVYVIDKAGKEHRIGATVFVVGIEANLYEIMGETSVTVDQMVAYYKAVTDYPGFYADTDAPTIRKFCQIYLNECNAEGVKAEVAFVQAMKETNFLRYGGDVDISQFNFAGLGAVGNGAKGTSFDSVTIGIRAHIQHLKAYASDEPLKKKCVDPRFGYVTRYSAPYVQWLGINENPYGKGWATDPRYGYDIVSRIHKLMTY